MDIFRKAGLVLIVLLAISGVYILGIYLDWYGQHMDPGTPLVANAAKHRVVSQRQIEQQAASEAIGASSDK